MPAERTPFFCGSFPVATAVQTASADVGWSVARCITAPASRTRPKFGSRPSAVAPVMRSSEPASIARIVTRDGRSVVAGSRIASSGRVSSTGTRARPRSASGAAIDDGGDRAPAAAPTGAAGRGKLRAQRPTTTKRQAEAMSASMPLAISFTLVVGSSTSVNVRRFAHMSAAPAAAAAAPSHDSTPTLIHAGENSSRASSCRTTSQT